MVSGDIADLVVQSSLGVLWTGVERTFRDHLQKLREQLQTASSLPQGLSLFLSLMMNFVVHYI